MSIVKLAKMTIFGIAKDKPGILEGLQKLGIMHLVPLVPPPRKVESRASPKAERAYKALRFLTDLESKRRQVTYEENFDMYKVVDEALRIKLEIRRASDKKVFLNKRITNIEPWGDIVYPPEAALADYRLWYYILPLAKRPLLNKVDLPWQIVYLDNRYAYTVILSKHEPDRALMPVPRIHVGAKPKSTLLAELEETEVLLEELESQRQALTRYVYLLNVNLAEADNRAALANAAQKTLETEDLVAVQGWVPLKARKKITQFARTSGLACLEEKPEQQDSPPTLLEQPEKMSAAIDLAMFYQVPGYRGWDPSWLLFVSFSLFFAMILADAGYGLLLFSFVLVFWKKFSVSPKGKAYRLLCLSLTLSSIVYGVMVGSYFGVAPEQHSVLGTLQFLNVSDFDVMMKVSIVIGVVHISIANLTLAYVNRHRPVAIAKLGWLLVIVGGLFYWISGPSSSAQMLGLISFLAGLVAVVLFSSERKVTKFSDYVLRLLEGIFSLKGLLNAFGDVLSYMRLFALGLASASLAITFNDLAREAQSSIAGGGLLIAILILLVGHGLNLILSIMSGVVHGLRLNYIEFYNWGQSEEGKPFQRFSRKEIEP